MSASLRQFAILGFRPKHIVGDIPLKGMNRKDSLILLYKSGVYDNRHDMIWVKTPLREIPEATRRGERFYMGGGWMVKSTATCIVYYVRGENPQVIKNMLTDKTGERQLPIPEFPHDLIHTDWYPELMLASYRPTEVEGFEWMGPEALYETEPV